MTINSFAKNLELIIKCYIHFFRRGNACRDVVNPHSFVVFQNAKLGDMVCTTPLFRAIKQNYPNSKLIVIGNSINKELLEGNKDIDEYIVFKNNSKEVISQLKNRQISYGVLATPDALSLSILYLSNIKTIVCPVVTNGKSPYETMTYKIIRLLCATAKHTMGNYAPREYLNLLKKAQIRTDDTTKHLSFSEAGRLYVQEIFLNNKIVEGSFLVGISPSAGNKIKNWGGEHFAKVAEFIAQKYNAIIIIIGSSKDKVEVDVMIEKLSKNVKVINTTGMLSLDALKALISKLNMFISVDTGPIYIAEAFSIPTIDIVGPMDEREQPPQGRLHRIVKLSNRKKPELHIMNARVYNTEEALRQIREISEEMVIEEVEQLMIELKK